MKCFRAAAPSRRQLVRNTLAVVTTLMVARAASATAAPAANSLARQDVKFEEENQRMPETHASDQNSRAQDEVYRALTTVDGIHGWSTRDAALDPKVGGTGEFGFYGHRMVINVKVAALVPPTHVAWNVLSSTGGAFDGTTVSFDLKSEGDIASLLFTHKGFKDSGNNIASATTRWGFYLLSLKRYLEGGKGTPNPEDTELIR